MKLKILVVIASMLLCNQAFAYASAAAASAAATASSTAAISLMRDREIALQSNLRSFQINASGILDLTGRRICDLTKNYDSIVNCAQGDIILFYTSYSDSKMFPRMFQSCKMDEPVYFNGNYLVCVYQDNKDKVEIYTPQRVKRKKVIKTVEEEQPSEPVKEVSWSERFTQTYSFVRYLFSRLTGWLFGSSNN